MSQKAQSTRTVNGNWALAFVLILIKGNIGEYAFREEMFVLPPRQCVSLLCACLNEPNCMCPHSKMCSALKMAFFFEKNKELRSSNEHEGSKTPIIA